MMYCCILTNSSSFLIIWSWNDFCRRGTNQRRWACFLVWLIVSNLNLLITFHRSVDFLVNNEYGIPLNQMIPCIWFGMMINASRIIFQNMVGNWYRVVSIIFPISVRGNVYILLSCLTVSSQCPTVSGATELVNIHFLLWVHMVMKYRWLDLYNVLFCKRLFLRINIHPI